jgi:hypothetical protein
LIAPAESSRLYAPSLTTEQLWLVQAKVSASGVEHNLEGKVDLGFAGSSIAVHPPLPLLYVGGGGGPAGKIPAAALALDEKGTRIELRPFERICARRPEPSGPR